MRWILLLGLLFSLPASAQIEGLTGSEDTLALVDIAFEAVGAARIDCAVDGDEDETLTICAAYARGFSAFKSDLEDALRRHSIPAGLVSLEPWRFRDRAYARAWRLEECRIALDLDEQAARLTVRITRFDEPEDDDEDPEPGPDPAEP